MGRLADGKIGRLNLQIYQSANLTMWVSAMAANLTMWVSLMGVAGSGRVYFSHPGRRTLVRGADLS